MTLSRTAALPFSGLPAANTIEYESLSPSLGSLNAKIPLEELPPLFKRSTMWRSQDARQACSRVFVFLGRPNEWHRLPNLLVHVVSSFQSARPCRLSLTPLPDHLNHLTRSRKTRCPEGARHVPQGRSSNAVWRFSAGEILRSDSSELCPETLLPCPATIA